MIQSVTKEQQEAVKEPETFSISNNGKAKTKIVVFGAGRWGPNLIRNLDAFEDTSVVGVIDPDPQAREALHGLMPHIPLYENGSSVFDEQKPDAVVIATPATTHVALIDEALDRNLHVMVEKPLSPSSAATESLAAKADALDRILMTDHVFLFNPGIRKVKEILDSGLLGNIIYMKSTRTNLGPVRSDVNALWDLAAHDLSIFSWWLDSQPDSVSAKGVAGIQKGIEDVVFASYTYPQNVMCQVHASWLNPRKIREIIVVGDGKMLAWDDLSDNPVTIYHNGGLGGNQRTNSYAMHKNLQHSNEIESIPVDPGEPLKLACRHFIDCVKGEVQCISGPDIALGVVQALEAGDRSIAAGGATVQVRP